MIALLISYDNHLKKGHLVDYLEHDIQADLVHAKAKAENATIVAKNENKGFILKVYVRLFKPVIFV